MTSAALSDFERDFAQLMVSTLDLEIEAADIDPEASLFYKGLGLDSIDALELALEIFKRFGVQLKSGDANNEQIFASMRSLAQYVELNKKH